MDVDTTEEAIAIAKHRIQDRVVEVDEENTCQVEDEELIKKKLRKMKEKLMKKRPELPLSQKNSCLKTEANLYY